MNTYRTLAAVTALSLGALAANAAPQEDYEINYPAATPAAAPSTVTREAVITELIAARKAGTLPREGDWYNEPAPLGKSTLAREAVLTDAAAHTQTTGSEQ